MTGLVVVADTGRALQRLTEELCEVPGVAILRHFSGRRTIGTAVAAIGPDIVVVDEMRWPRLALTRVAEIHEHTGARIIVRASRPEAGWLADALRAGACAVAPAGAGVLGLVVQEVVNDLGRRGNEVEPAALAA